jgi:hypothetical protein
MEDLARPDEQVRLGGQVRSPGLHEVDHRQPVTPGDLQRAQGLAQGVGVHRTTAHGGVVGDQDALDTGYDADPGHDARAHRKVGAPGGQRGQLKQW